MEKRRLHLRDTLTEWEWIILRIAVFLIFVSGLLAIVQAVVKDVWELITVWHY